MNAVRGVKSGAALPVVVDVGRLRRRLAGEEKAERQTLAELEDRLRRFEDVERPAYERWLRVELGPALTGLEEATAALRIREMTAARVQDLVDIDGWHPREARHLAEHGTDDEGGRSARPADQPQSDERDAIEARRHAKRQRKRAERKLARRQRTSADAAAPEDGNRLTALYRGLARRLHPDSPTVLRSLDAGRVRAIWAEVQAAYAGRSRERLLALSAWIETVAGTEESGTADSGAALLSVAERHDRLRALRRSRTALERRLAEAAGDPAWEFETTLPRVRRRLKKEAARRLADELARVEEVCAEIERWLASIGPPRPPRKRR